MQDDLMARFTGQGQGHVFAHWATLGEAERASLLADAARVDFSWIGQRMFEAGSGVAPAKPPVLTPAPVIRLPATPEDEKARRRARAAGERALRKGRLAAFLVAGGQGTRLGYDGPKGCYPVGPATDRTLFAWHAEQILARARRYGCVIPWYIMTSRDNDAATRAYFEQNAWLGFDPKDVMIFEQAVVPSLGEDGKLLLAEPGRLAMNPDGHGGSLRALVASGAIADMKRRGVDTISYFQVDNPLVTICDPVFAGHHLLARAQMSSKILDKACPEEKVGHLCFADGKLTVIEYSDMDPALTQAREADGRLRFWAGSIAIHMLSVGFVESVGGGAKLPWRIARKKVPVWTPAGVVRPEKPNAIKFETFVFDALPLARASVTLEVAREEEFAPVKNPSGVDSAESCRQMLSDRAARWLEAAGVSVPRGADGHAVASIEIPPLYALDAAELKRKVGRRLKVGRTLVLA